MHATRVYTVNEKLVGPAKPLTILHHTYRSFLVNQLYQTWVGALLCGVLWLSMRVCPGVHASSLLPTPCHRCHWQAHAVTRRLPQCQAQTETAHAGELVRGT